MTAAAHPRPELPKSVNPRGALQDQRLAVWTILLRKHRTVPKGKLVPGNLVIGNELGHEILRTGVAGRVLTPLAELLELGPTQLAPVIGVDRATARRYAREDQALPKHSAETVMRLAELEALAMDVFATEQGAHGWLKTEHPLLGETPIDAASTSYGAQRVREILSAIKYGGVV